LGAEINEDSYCWRHGGLALSLALNLQNTANLKLW
jgi:hypothetical protein